ncbi:MAG: hypothetical protein JWM78_1664 [Verrucomicrobiaceae bacterium]|nr:hypothetical protein [Verrucomicrobiaceae bacterium]
MTLRRYIEPAEQPLSLAEMKVHLKVDDDITEDDGLINSLIVAATRHVEQITGRVLVKQQWQKKLDAFPCNGGAIEIRKPPVIAIDQIEFTDLDGVRRTLDPQCFELDAQSETAWIVPAYGFIWPTARDQINAITITFTAGYGVAAVVPEDLKAVIKLLVGNWYENREATTDKLHIYVVPFAVEALLSTYIVMSFV